SLLPDEMLADLWEALTSSELKDAWETAAGGKSASRPSNSGCYRWQGVPDCVTKTHYEILKAAMKHGTKDGPVWTNKKAAKYAWLKLTDPAKAKAFVTQFKKDWIKAYAGTIKAAANMFNIPAYLLAGILYAEVGGSAPGEDDIAIAVRDHPSI